MNKRDEIEHSINNEGELFLAYNMGVTKIKMADMQYSEDSKEMCEVAVMGVLAEVYLMRSVYENILQYMMDNGIYERYLRPILELQLNPPKEKEVESKSENGESSENEKGDNSEKNKGKNGGVSTKTDKHREISKKMIEDMFRIDENDF